MTEIDFETRLTEIDAAIALELPAWNVAGLGVAIVVGDELRFAKGYGFRDLGSRLPFTANTLCPVASNTKLFTAVACGMLVEEGLLTWDLPVKRSVPSIEFFNDHLNENVTLRDMLSHQTGITRHDHIWYKSTLNRLELFKRLKLLEPHAPIRTQHLYNNMMYAAAGYLIELQTGLTWERFLRERVLDPLGMHESGYSIAEMTSKPDHGVPYSEKRDGFDMERVPYYEDTEGMAPCGALITNLQEMSYWLRTLLNDGQFNGKTVVAPSILAATMQPTLAMPNLAAESKGYWENLNAANGMGRVMSVYRGNLISFHGGYLDGFHTQVSIMPRDKFGVAVYVIGDHAGALPNAITFNIYERLLGLSVTPWSERWLKERLADKEAATKKRADSASATKVTTTSEGPVPGGKPAHPLNDYVGEFESPSYGVIRISAEGGGLKFQFNRFVTDLGHVRFERFDTPDDDHFGKYSLNFFTNTQGDVDRIFMSIDLMDMCFSRKPPALGENTLKALAGRYRTPSNNPVDVVFRGPADLLITRLAQAELKLVPYRGLLFRCEASPDLWFEFVQEAEAVTAFKLTDPTGTIAFPRDA